MHSLIPYRPLDPRFSLCQLLQERDMTYSESQSLDGHTS
jgi:hypothetical protein